MTEFNTLVSAAELARHPEWRVVDCRHDLSQPALGAQRYAQGHLPGAVHAHLDDDLSGPKTGGNGRHPLPARTAFVAWLQKNGITGDDQVVAYDDAGGAYAARLWWLLRSVGHTRVAVLDGGLDAWKATGGALTQDLPRHAASTFKPQGTDASPTVDVHDVLRNLQARESLVLDARGASRYAGVGETIDPVGGHIPGAANRPYMDNLGADGRFKPADALRAEFEAVLGAWQPQQVIAQCGSGVTACHNLLALQVAGLTGARLYPGSWSEWCSDPARPVARGEVA